MTTSSEYGADCRRRPQPDHICDVDPFVHWCGCPAYGPFLIWRGEAPRTELIEVRPSTELPCGLVALYDERGSMETPVHLPEQRAIVFAGGLTAPGGVLRAW